MPRRKKNKSTFTKKFFIVFLFLIILSTLFAATELYQRIFKPNILFPGDEKAEFIFIPSGAEFTDVLEILTSKGLLVNSNSFEWLAKQRKYVDNVKSGKYHIREGLNNKELINLLNSGNQTVVRLTFNNLRNKEEFAGVS